MKKTKTILPLLISASCAVLPERAPYRMQDEPYLPDYVNSTGACVWVKNDNDAPDTGKKRVVLEALICDSDGNRNVDTTEILYPLASAPLCVSARYRNGKKACQLPTSWWDAAQGYFDAVRTAAEME